MNTGSAPAPTIAPRTDARGGGTGPRPPRPTAKGTARTVPTRTGTQVTGWGRALPDGVVTNADLEANLETSDDWIATRTGIGERRWATDGETTGPLATIAATRALTSAGIPADEISLVIVATCTPEVPMPPTAAMVAEALGTRAGAFDINAACAGFPYALATAASLLNGGLGTSALVIGADTMSRIVDHNDRNTAVLFGDGAAALVLSTDRTPIGSEMKSTSSTTPNGPSATLSGIVATDLVADGAGLDLLRIPAGGAGRPASPETVAEGGHTIRMQGRELFRQAVRAATASIRRTLDRAEIGVDDIALFVPHQANDRITEALVARVGIPAGRTWSNLARLGNTSAASIPLALCEAAEAKVLDDGDLVLLCGFGAGLTVGTILWRWDTASGVADE